jgi:hypothetical protein
VSTSTSNSGHETSANIISEGSMTQNNFNPILIGSSSESIGSLPSVMVYPASNPRYEHPSRPVAKRSCETSNSVCNKPRSCQRSNPVVKLVTPIRLHVPSTASADHVIVLESASVDHVILLESASTDQILLENDSGCPSAWNDEEETDPDVLAWIAAQDDIAAKGDKVSYEATRKFQES